MKFIVSTPVSVEPISLSDARAHIRALTGDTSEDTALITPSIKAAREYCEGRAGLSLAAQTIKAYPKVFDYVMQLPREPVTAITSVKYTDEDGVEVTMAASNYFLAKSSSQLGIIEIPDFIPRILEPIEITYTAGFTTVPYLVRQAMLLLIGYWYEKRGDDTQQFAVPSQIENRVDRMLNQDRTWFA